MGFFRQEYWSGLPFPSPGDLPNPGIEHSSPALQADALTSEPPGKPKSSLISEAQFLKPNQTKPKNPKRFSPAAVRPEDAEMEAQARRHLVSWVTHRFPSVWSVNADPRLQAGRFLRPHWLLFSEHRGQLWNLCL